MDTTLYVLSALAVMQKIHECIVNTGQDYYKTDDNKDNNKDSNDRRQ